MYDTAIWPSAAVKMAISFVGQSEAQLASSGLNVSADAVQEHIEDQRRIHIALLKACRNQEPEAIKHT